MYDEITLRASQSAERSHIKMMEWKHLLEQEMSMQQQRIQVALEPDCLMDMMRCGVV